MHAHQVFQALLFFALLPATLLAWSVVPATASVIRVPQDYATIQDAVDAAKLGDTIQVANGTYYENVLVSKRVAIVGESNTNTIVDGGGNDIVFNIQANNVEIRQFTIRNRNIRYSGIYSYMYGGFVIRDNRISQNVVGISLAESDGNIIDGNILLDNSMYGISLLLCGSNTIENNNIANSGFGIDVQDSSGNLIASNTISDTSYGIYLAYARNNNVSANTLTDNSWNMYLVNSDSNTVSQNEVSGGSVGIELYLSHGNSIMNNTVIDTSYGIYLAHCGASTIAGNNASLNDWGIELYNSTGSTIIENLISYNTWGAYIVADSDGNRIYHNNFIDNTKGAYQDLTSSNPWNTPTTPYQGNYWSDYKGEDTNGDGVGDTYLPWEAVDWYPLMSPLGGIHDIAIVNVTVSATSVIVGGKVNVTVFAKNEGTFPETFNVMAKYNSTIIGTQTVSHLASNTETTLTFVWDTLNATPCFNYTIAAEAIALPNEVDLDDNTYVDGTVKVNLPDLNGDGKVNIIDLAMVGKAYGTELGDPLWDPIADINDDGIVNIDDLIIVAVYYGETCG